MSREYGINLICGLMLALALMAGPAGAQGASPGLPAMGPDFTGHWIMLDGKVRFTIRFARCEKDQGPGCRLVLTRRQGGKWVPIVALGLGTCQKAIFHKGKLRWVSCRLVYKAPRTYHLLVDRKWGQRRFKIRLVRVGDR
jgi:hypothetical protein